MLVGGRVALPGGGIAGIILCMHPANGRRRYNVTSSLIGWAHSQSDHWNSGGLVMPCGSRDCGHHWFR